MKHSSYSKLNLAVKELRKVYSDFPLPMVLVFLEVCQNPSGLTVNQIKQRTGLSQSSTSRHCRGLTKKMTPTRDGLDLCEFVPDPSDFRSKLLKLNDKGKALEAALEQAVK